jgi:Na+-driven multidrug efflux pump
MITQVSENGVVFVLNLFLGRLAHPDLAIAAFGVVYGLVRVILAPLRNLVNTSQALVHQREDLRMMFQFTFGLLVFYVAMIVIMFFTPLRDWILATVMGLTLELDQYCTPAVKLTMLIAVFWATAALLRGILSAMRKTGAIALTAFIRLFVIAGIGSVSFFQINFNGAVLGVLAIAGAFLAETVVLGWRLRIQTRSPDAMFYQAV